MTKDTAKKGFKSALLLNLVNKKLHTTYKPFLKPMLLFISHLKKNVFNSY